ncbi:efflux RND transporter periplasmic adaptor subunit [Kineobactrum salinum]|uniref:Efflux RND transporter periplasmic adaptor subunit n=1 Tax=Kineobactrum salinum TaxID=2708301 RepID=A0A6C0U6R1_9GAMM|nr:efflux RND transporter periplasmic adaptor subunit [Kineobactrum salinum]QIB65134.1 efflux RND transporter periplasmic adaptor subunit [Kineobactrum salinum]
MQRACCAITVVSFVAVLLSACSSEAPSPHQPAPEVSVITLQSERVTITRELSGRTSPFRVAEIRPQVNGIVEQRLFTEGATVKSGEPLYQLDEAMYRADYNSAKATLERAEAALEIAQLNAGRLAGLVESGAVSKQEGDTARTTLRQAEADVSVARAALARTEISLNYASISSPISGIVGRSTVTQGALVTANQAEPLATVQQLDPIYVDVNQSVVELLALRKALEGGRLSRGDQLPVTIVLEGGSTYEREGSLAFSDVSVDPSTGSTLLRVVVENPDHVLLPGMYVRAVIGEGVRNNAILVPQQAIARNPRGDTSAMVVTPEGEVEHRQVTVSRSIGDKWLVEGGLNAGERVIIEGLQKVQPGDALSAHQISEASMAGHDRDFPEMAATFPSTAAVQ